MKIFVKPEQQAEIDQLEERYKAAFKSVESLRASLFYLNQVTQLFRVGTANMTADELLEAARGILNLRKLEQGRVYTEPPLENQQNGGATND